MKFFASFVAILAMTTPGLVRADEEIGIINATFGDEQISQSTVIATRGDKTSPTAYLLQIGGGISALNFFGYDPGNARLDVSLTYMKDVPEVQTPPIDMTIR